MNKRIPTGNYCYGYVPAKKSGFRTLADVDAYLDSLPQDKYWPEWFRLYLPIRCPYWRHISHGRVCCKFLGRRAVIWNRRSEHLAEVFYRKHPKARDRDTGWLLGDAVKECKINRNGPDFSFPS